jgi:23S rRNA (cytosine1962-C5)-methyltransferase
MVHKESSSSQSARRFRLTRPHALQRTPRLLIIMLATFLLSAPIRTRAFSVHNWRQLMSYRTIQNVPPVALSVSTTTSPTATDTADGDSDFGRVVLKRNRQSKAFRDGSQLVFSGSLGKTLGSPAMGSLVQVEVPVSADEKNDQTQVIGWGVYNPTSMYRVRILCHSQIKPKLSKTIKNIPLDEHAGEGNISSVLKSIISDNFENAVKVRRAMGLPSPETDTYRLINGEGDNLSGLAVDVIGGKVAVVMSSAAWCEIHKSLITDCLQNILPNLEIIWKTTASRLKQDGYELEMNDEEENLSFVQQRPVEALENGIKYETYPFLDGQKTGVYCDQRDNRFDLAKQCKSKTVLDLCCYHGGFSLNAAKLGASKVVGVDSSQDAVDACTANAALNGFTTTEFIRSDIAEFMKTCNDKFDVVVLDPPKLAPSVSGLQRASRKYHSLNRDAIKLINEDNGGLLMTCTCSAAMTQKDGGKFFLQTVQQASLSAQREITLLRVSGAAPCHVQSPISFPAGNYLTAALFYVHPKK